MLTTRLISIAIVILVLSVFVSCQKESNANTYLWNQTLCSDPWGANSSSTDAEISAAIENYFSNKKVKVFNVTVDHSNDFSIVCEACHCTSGTIITVSVDGKKESEMLEIGFEKVP